jgi:hypothetical protein
MHFNVILPYKFTSPEVITSVQVLLIKFYTHLLYFLYLITLIIFGEEQTTDNEAPHYAFSSASLYFPPLRPNILLLHCSQTHPTCVILMGWQTCLMRMQR